MDRESRELNNNINDLTWHNKQLLNQPSRNNKATASFRVTEGSYHMKFKLGYVNCEFYVTFSGYLQLGIADFFFVAHHTLSLPPPPLPLLILIYHLGSVGCYVLFKDGLCLLLQSVFWQSLKPFTSLPELNVFVTKFWLEEVFKQLNPVWNKIEAPGQTWTLLEYSLREQPNTPRTHA